MNTTENATAKDFFKFLGVLISFIFSALFFFLKLIGGSNNTDGSEDPLVEQERRFNDLTSTSSEARTNPMNTYSENYDD